MYAFLVNFILWRK